MSSTFGNYINLSIFGESHGAGVGVVIDGLRGGYSVDLEKLQQFMDRRRPGKNKMSTARKETDEVHVISGIVDGKTCGSPICLMINNSDAHSKDYSKLRDVPRPGHADYPAHVKHNGFNDIRGGGHFSARVTAGLCAAGGLFMQILEEKGIYIGAHLLSVGHIKDISYDPVNVSIDDIKGTAAKEVPTMDDEAGAMMKARIESVREELDSIGGMIECAVLGLPVGIGEPIFDGIENEISKAVFGVPAVKGIEFGAGMEVARMLGSENNDEYYYDGDTVKTYGNNHGGILGGLSSGMPVIFRAALKPTPSIYKEQRSVSLSQGEDTILSIEGRHDPCVAVRGVPCIEAATAIAIADLVLGAE